ncbi:ATP-binding protein [Plantactinospora sp. B5E13]|uniref:ATP-binding protein n=1 Tax=Plantactinospora sp. B5E13 TaxID=3153758 RepID=UPI00325E586F
MPPPQIPPGPLHDLKAALYRRYLQAGPPTLDEIHAQVETLAEDLGAFLARTDATGDDVEELADGQVGAVPSRDTIRRVLGGAALPPGRQDTVAVGVALALLAGESRPDVVAEEIRRGWDRAAVAAPAEVAPALPSGGSRRFFDHLLEYHNEKFAGRNGEVRTILDYIDRHDCGYLFVDGLSGYGKTSLLAVLVRQQPGFLYHFISQRYKTAGGAFDPTQLNDLLSNLCEQLEPHRAAPRGGRALTTRFLEVVAADRGRPTVLVLDAIDEVDRHPSFLFGLLPKRLPKNLFILLSARSQGNRSYLSEVGLAPDDIGLRVTLSGLDADAVRDLLLHYAGTAGAALGERAGFVDNLWEVSAGDPFYLRFLVEDVEHGRLTPENIRRTPSGLSPYLDEQFAQLHRSADSDLHSDVLGLILVADGPLHRSDLLRMVDGLTGGKLDQVVRDVQRFLLRTGEEEYTFCHNRFKEYFLEKM